MTTQTFAQLQLAPDLLAAAQRFAAPTAVQCAAIPVVLRGGDLQCTAPTGQGKTAAFALPLLSLLTENPSDQKPRPIRVLVLAPTRELVAQIAVEIESFARFVTRLIKVRAVFGGVAVNPQMMALRGGADVLVATPGRLLDLHAQNAVKLDALCTLVLDEADHMVGAGFADELDRILALLPKDRQTLWFSATQASDAAWLKKWLNAPAIVALDTESHAVDAAAVLERSLAGGVNEPLKNTALIDQRAIAVDPSRRTQLLRHLIHSNPWGQVLVFVATRHAAQVVAEKISKSYPSAPCITALALHGEMAQGARAQALADFKAGRVQVLVATDLAARGLHIDGLPVVVNYDLPRSPSDFTHRIGRTGRAGQQGLALSFVSPATRGHFALIQKRQNSHMDLETIAGFEVSPADDVVSDTVINLGLDPAGGIKGARPSKKDKLRAAAAAFGAAT